MAYLTLQEVKRITSKRLGGENFEIVSFHKNIENGVSLGFLSAVQKVTITYKEEDIINKFNVFIKRLSSNSSHREVFPAVTENAFRKEKQVFNLFLNKIKFDKNDSWPTCYLATNDLVVLEDLSEKGFRNVGILEPLDIDHCLKVIDSLARLHAASLGYEKSENLKLPEIIEGLEKDIIYSKDESHKPHLQTGIKSLRKIAEIYLPHYPRAIVGKAFDCLTDVPQNLDPSTKYPNVLSHNDLWANNIMFSYDSNGKISKSCLIDFQCSIYMPPTFDVQLMLHCCTSKDIRKQHGNHLREHYFNQLQKFSAQYGLNSECTIHWNTFEKMWEETLPIALALAVQFMNFVAIPEHIIKPIIADNNKWRQYYLVDKNDVVILAASESPEYRNKLIEGLEDIFDYFISQSKI